MKLKELIKGLKVVEYEGDLEIEIGSIAYDSRKSREGSFCLYRSFKVDGHKYTPGYRKRYQGV